MIECTWWRATNTANGLNDSDTKNIYINTQTLYQIHSKHSIQYQEAQISNSKLLRQDRYFINVCKKHLFANGKVYRLTSNELQHISFNEIKLICVQTKVNHLLINRKQYKLISGLGLLQKIITLLMIMPFIVFGRTFSVFNSNVHSVCWFTL